MINKTEKTNLAVVSNTIPKLPQKTANYWDKYLSSCEKRTNVCPVRKKAGINDGIVTEFLVELSLFVGDKKEQNRLLGADANKISELANQLYTSPEGLKVGICAALGPDGLHLRWGNHRKRATEQNNQNSLAIPNMPTGKIWTSIYNFPASEVRKWQAVENNLHDVSTPATKADNVHSLREMVADGILDYNDSKFVDCDDEEKDNRLRQIIKDTMPHWTSKSSTLIREFRRQNKNVFRVDSYTVPEAREYFKNNCPLDGEHDFSSYASKKGDIIKSVLADGSTKITRVLFTHTTGADIGGALFQTALRDKYVDEVCDEVVLVSCHNAKAEAGLKGVRDSRVDLINHWNTKLPKVIDRICVLPQTALEKKTSPFVSNLEL